MGNVRRLWTLALGCAAVLLGSGLVPGSRVLGQDVEALLQQGMESYQAGDKEAALRAFEAAFQLKPSNDALSKWVDDVRLDVILRMAQEKNSRLAGAATAILKGARTFRGELNEDAAQIEQAVQGAIAASGEERIRLVIEATQLFGRNLVPALLPLLGDAELENRSLAFSWIARSIRRDAIPPLVAAWKHPDERVRVNVAKLLGSSPLRDPYSAAYLAGMVESDTSSVVREAASEALQTIVTEANGSDASEPAKVRFLRNATQLFLNPHRNRFDRSSYSASVFDLVDGQVVATRVARFQVAERMAQQNLREALALDSGFRLAHVLNLLNDCAQVVEYDHQYKWNQSQDSAGDDRALLEAQKPYIDSVVRLRTLAAPSDVVYSALGEANKRGRSEIARYLIERIRERQLKGAVPDALVDALEDKNSRLVRVAAAIAIAERNPTSGFDAGAQVVSMLESAVVRSGVRTVVRAMGNKDLANRFHSMIEQLGMESRFELDSSSEAYVTITNLPPDLVLIDDELAAESAFASAKQAELPAVFVNALRRDYRTVNVPVIIVVDPARLESTRQTYQNEENRVWVVPSNIDVLQLEKSVLAEIFAGADDDKSLANEVAADAARALESLASANNPVFPVAGAVESLTQSLAKRTDVVRLPVIRALGAIGSEAAIPGLAQVFSNADNASEVRATAMKALGRILSASKGKVSDAVAAVIREGASASDPEVRKVAWAALGDAGIDPSAVFDIYFSSSAAAAPVADGTESTETDAGEDVEDPFADSEEESDSVDEPDSEEEPDSEGESDSAEESDSEEATDADEDL
jgi:hypothetical protein